MRGARRFVVVGLLLALLALGGAGRVDAGEDALWLDVDARLDEALTTFERGDMELAIRQLTAVAEAGNSRAQLFLGSLYSKGFGVDENHCRALEWYRLAADNGDSKAAASLGAAFEIFRCGPVDADMAVHYYKRAAEFGDAAASYLGLAFLYDLDGWGRRDPLLAYEMAILAWSESRHENNFIAMTAALMLGIDYDSGSGVARNWKEAKRHYSYSARQGSVGAQYFLGMLLVQKGEFFDRTEALKWIFMAADQGFEPAVAIRKQYELTLEKRSLAKLSKAAQEELWRISELDSPLGATARWCQENRPGSFDCVRFALADSNICDPSITETYFKTRYMHSDAYRACRREAFEARE